MILKHGERGEKHTRQDAPSGGGGVDENVEEDARADHGRAGQDAGGYDLGSARPAGQPRVRGENVLHLVFARELAHALIGRSTLYRPFSTPGTPSRRYLSDSV